MVTVVSRSYKSLNGIWLFAPWVTWAINEVATSEIDWAGRVDLWVHNIVETFRSLFLFFRCVFVLFRWNSQRFLRCWLNFFGWEGITFRGLFVTFRICIKANHSTLMNVLINWLIKNWCFLNRVAIIEFSLLESVQNVDNFLFSWNSTPHYFFFDNIHNFLIGKITRLPIILRKNIVQNVVN